MLLIPLLSSQCSFHILTSAAESFLPQPFICFAPCGGNCPEPQHSSNFCSITVATFVAPDECALDLWLSCWITSGLFFWGAWIYSQVRNTSEPSIICLASRPGQDFPNRKRKRWLHGISFLLLLCESCQKCWQEPDRQEWWWWPAPWRWDGWEGIQAGLSRAAGKAAAQCPIHQVPVELWGGQGRWAGEHPAGCSHVAGNSTMSVFSFQPWHNQPNIGHLELSLKPKSFSGLVCTVCLSNELITATTCCLLHGTVLVMCSLLWGWVLKSLDGIPAWFVGRKHGEVLGFVNTPMHVSCQKSFQVVTVWSSIL